MRPTRRQLLAPPNIEGTYSARGWSDAGIVRFVHLVSRLQEFNPVEGIRVRLQSSGSPKLVSQIPHRETVAFEWKNGYIEFLAHAGMHSAYMIEG